MWEDMRSAKNSAIMPWYRTLILSYQGRWDLFKLRLEGRVRVRKKNAPGTLKSFDRSTR
jgi:hypothetical protein